MDLAANSRCRPVAQLRRRVNATIRSAHAVMKEAHVLRPRIVGGHKSDEEGSWPTRRIRPGAFEGPCAAGGQDHDPAPVVELDNGQPGVGLCTD